MAVKGKTFGYEDPPGASIRERDQFRQDRKRAARAKEGLCPYCGRHPEPGFVRCPRCIALARLRYARWGARQKRLREAEARASRPRRCAGCNGSDLKKAGVLGGRQRYRCRSCGRQSYGDGPPAPAPDYPCPYCGGRCRKNGHQVTTRRKPQLYKCTVCGRINTNLWPEDTPSPGGPFPHPMTFDLNYAAHQALLVYCQEKKMSVPEAVRDIFTLAGQAPMARLSSARVQYGADGGKAATVVRSAVIPAPALPAIPPGGIRFPSEQASAFEKLMSVKVGRYFIPSVMVTLQVRVALNDAALAGLVETMRRRGLGRHDTARALIAETYRPFRPVMAGGYGWYGADGW